MATDPVVREIVKRVIDAMNAAERGAVPIEISARHVHLCQAHLDELFGAGGRLTRKRDISQPGQFLCEERVRLVGPRGVLDNVAILGPSRAATQVELSRTDAFQLGVSAPLRMSGDLAGAADILITFKDKCVAARGSAIVARNHIHMTPLDASRYRIGGRRAMDVRVEGERAVVFEGVPIRVDDNCALAMHIDIDEANACLCAGNPVGILLRREGGGRE